MLQDAATCCIMLQDVAGCVRMFQDAATSCIVLQDAATCCYSSWLRRPTGRILRTVHGGPSAPQCAGVASQALSTQEVRPSVVHPVRPHPAVRTHGLEARERHREVRRAHVPLRKQPPRSKKTTQAYNAARPTKTESQPVPRPRRVTPAATPRDSRGAAPPSAARGRGCAEVSVLGEPCALGSFHVGVTGLGRR